MASWKVRVCASRKSASSSLMAGWRHLTTRRPTMPTPTAPLLRGVRQIAWTVHDVPAAVRFWRDALGARLLFEPPGMAFFEVGGLRVMVSRPSKPEFDHPNSILFF